ncbi:MAG: hypothetical protein QGH45_13065 [Myxococcota bacterium]|jgi:hypothetical protein|nr:hypothetical protein [Myxococcota bacterium]
MTVRLVASLAMLVLMLGCMERTQDPTDLEAKAQDMRADTPSAQGDSQAGSGSGGSGGDAGDHADGGAGGDGSAEGGEPTDGTAESGGVTPPDPEAAGGQAATGAPPGHSTPFETTYVDKPMVTVSGTLVVDEGVTGTVDIDCFAPDPDDPNKRELVNKVKIHQPGAYEMKIPKDFGALILEAFIDSDGDGPDDGDARGEFANNPLMVGGEDIADVDIELIEPPKSAGGGAWRGGGRREIETDKSTN